MTYSQYSLGIFLEELRKIATNSVRITGVPPEF
jgi:hypothetical protein